MTPETKARAKAKVSRCTWASAIPTSGSTTAGLQIAKDDAIGNVERAELFEYRHQLAKLGQPVDQTEWWMTPQTVNAVNLPLQNALNFPAAILQKPFFDPGATPPRTTAPSAPPSATRSATASTTSAASSTPRAGSPTGGRRGSRAFQAAGEALVAQYDAYRPCPDLAINGQAGPQREHRRPRRPGRRLRRLSSVAERPAGQRSRLLRELRQSWRDKSREESIRLQVTTDGHSPDAYRAATIRNLDAWYGV